MLVFGHVGITLGAAITLSTLQNYLRLSKTTQNETEKPLSPLSRKVQTHNYSLKKNSSFMSLVKRIDIRLLLIGSLLPDIIDKPIGHLLFKESLSNGRIFSHTLLFLILLTLWGLFFNRRYGKTWFLSLSFGTFVHLILDQIWHTPKTLLWPILGLSFEKLELTGWIEGIWHALLTDPAIYIPELIGLFVLIWFLWILLRKRTFYAFARYGQIQ